MDTVEEVLAHFGVKGMKWGVRKRSGLKEPASSDAKAAYKHITTIKKSGTKALTNDELQQLVTRMNLEQQYANLSSKRVNPGKKFAQDLLVGFGKSTAQTAFNSAASKLVSSAMSGSMKMKPG